MCGMVWCAAEGATFLLRRRRVRESDDCRAVPAERGLLAVHRQRHDGHSVGGGGFASARSTWHDPSQRHQSTG